MVSCLPGAALAVELQRQCCAVSERHVCRSLPDTRDVLLRCCYCEPEQSPHAMPGAQGTALHSLLAPSLSFSSTPWQPGLVMERDKLVSASVHAKSQESSG